MTKLLIQTHGGLYVSFSYDIGRSFKELDMVVAVSNEYEILKFSFLTIYKCYMDESQPLNLHDLRMLQNKQIGIELEKMALILNDNDLAAIGKNAKEKKLNKEILDKSNQIIESLGIQLQSISTLC